MVKTYLIFIFITFPVVFSECIKKSQQIHYVEVVLRNLAAMGPRLPEKCIPEAMTIQIKKRLKKIRSFQPAIKLASELFTEHLKEAERDDSTMKDVQELLNSLNGKYSDCTKGVQRTKQKKENRMNRYFDELKDFLSKQNYSNCAREVVRAEMQSFFRTLLMSLKTATKNRKETSRKNSLE